MLKRTTRKITSKGEEFLNFLRSLMAAVLALMKSVLTHLAKSALLPFRLTTALLATVAAIQERLWITHNSINNFK